jgi:hypothetical protein
MAMKPPWSLFRSSESRVPHVTRGRIIEKISPNTIIFATLGSGIINPLTLKEYLMAAQDYEGIRREVVDAGGLKCYRMQEVRDVSGYRKLGTGVNKEIHDELDKKGLGHSPNPLPYFQTESVYVYDKGSEAGRLMGAITGTPTEGGVREVLKRVNPNGDGESAEAKLEEVRKLLVQLDDIFRTDGDEADED